jgi:hypothetical protein
MQLECCVVYDDEGSRISVFFFVVALVAHVEVMVALQS